jgi:hypothetical protein
MGEVQLGGAGTWNWVRVGVANVYKRERLKGNHGVQVRGARCVTRWPTSRRVFQASATIQVAPFAWTGIGGEEEGRGGEND